MRLVDPAGQPFLPLGEGVWNVHGLGATVVDDRPLLVLATCFVADDPDLPGYDLTTKYGERPLRDGVDILDARDGSVVARIDLGWRREHGGTLRFTIVDGVLVGGFEYQPVRAWAIPSGEPIAQWRSRGQWRAIAASPAGPLLAVDDTVLRLATFTGREVGVRLRARNQRWRRGWNVWTVASAGPWVVAGTEVGELWIWDAASGERTALREFAHRGAITAAAAYEAGGRWYAATAGTDLSVNLWDVETGEPIRTVAGFLEEPPSVAFAAGELLVGGDLTLNAFDAATGEQRGMRARFEADDPDYVLGGDDNEYAEFLTIANVCEADGLFFTTPRAVWRLPR